MEKRGCPEDPSRPKGSEATGSYLGKQVDLDYVALDGFNSDFSKEKQ